MFSIRPIDESFNTEMRDIIRSAHMVTPLMELEFDRSPDVFALSKLWPGECRYLGIFNGEQLVGFGKVQTYTGFLRGSEQQYSYLGDVVIHREFQGRGLLKMFSETIIRQYFYSGSGQIGFCLILTGNHRAARYFGQSDAPPEEMPYFRHCTGYVTNSLLVGGSKKEVSGYEIREATPADKKLIAELKKVGNPGRFLEPVNPPKINVAIPNAEGISYLALREGNPVGFCVFRDVSGLKRTRVHKYRKHLALLYRFYQIIARLRRHSPIPKPGSTLKEGYITDFHIPDSRPEVLEALVTYVYNNCCNLRYNLLHVGSYREDKLLRSLKGFRLVRVFSELYIFSADASLMESFEKDNYVKKPFIDISRV